MKLALPTPLLKTPRTPPPPKGGILRARGFSSRKNQKMPGAHKIGAAISGPYCCPKHVFPFEWAPFSKCLILMVTSVVTNSTIPMVTLFCGWVLSEHALRSPLKITTKAGMLSLSRAPQNPRKEGKTTQKAKENHPKKARILNSVHTRCIVKTSGFTRGVCKNRGGGGFIKFKGFLLEFLENRRSWENQKSRNSPEKWTFLSLAFTMHLVCTLLRFFSQPNPGLLGSKGTIPKIARNFFHPSGE